MICEHKTAARTAVGWSFASWRSAVGVIWASGFDDEDIPCPDSVRTFKKVVQTDHYSSTDPESEASTTTLDVTVDAGANYNVFGYPTPITQIGSTFTGGPVDAYSGGVFSGTTTYENGDYTDTTVSTITFSQPITVESLTAEVLPVFEALSSWTAGSSCEAVRTINFATCGGAATQEPIDITLRTVRYRWRVPSSHLGTYYKITWDVLYEPVGWDDEDIPEAERPLRYSRTNLTVEWEGPGTGAQSDPSWLAGDWFVLELPEEPGVRKIINVRFKHMREGGV
jgi:hypothetical protein